METPVYARTPRIRALPSVRVRKIKLVYYHNVARLAND